MVEEVKQEQPRLQHLKQIESSMIEVMASQKLYETQATADYESQEFEEKNTGKYMATFPYPYMNGYLHLGKLYTLKLALETESGFVVSHPNTLIKQWRLTLFLNLLRSRLLSVQG